MARLDDQEGVIDQPKVQASWAEMALPRSARSVGRGPIFAPPIGSLSRSWARRPTAPSHTPRSSGARSSSGLADVVSRQIDALNQGPHHRRHPRGTDFNIIADQDHSRAHADAEPDVRRDMKRGSSAGHGVAATQESPPLRVVGDGNSATLNDAALTPRLRPQPPARVWRPDQRSKTQMGAEDSRASPARACPLYKMGAGTGQASRPCPHEDFDIDERVCPGRAA